MFEFYALLLDPKLSKIAQKVLEKREQQRRTLASQLFILHSIFEKFKRDDDDNYGISVAELFPMMEKLGLKLEREKFEDLMIKYDPEGTHLIRPERFTMLLLEHAGLRRPKSKLSKGSFLAQIQQRKHQKDAINLFKADNFIDVFLVSLC